MPVSTNYLQYSPFVEQPQPDEQVVFDELSRTMQHITRKVASRYRQAYRSVHAKSHGILVGTLEVLPNLPPHLAQGLFSKPGATYAALMRFFTNPGDILTDKVSSPRESQYQTVARLVIPIQTAWDPAKDNYFEDLTFSPAHALAAHCPLGGINRARMFVYQRLAAQHLADNGKQAVIPTNSAEVPAEAKGA